MVPFKPPIKRNGKKALLLFCIMTENKRSFMFFFCVVFFTETQMPLFPSRALAVAGVAVVARVAHAHRRTWKYLYLV
jgi:hypothetical protein